MYSKDETKLLHKEFWETFNRYSIFFSREIGQPIQWMYYKTGIKGIELKFEIDTTQISVILEVNPRNEEKRFDYFVLLDAYRNILKEGFKEKLIWNEQVKLPEGKSVSRISISLEGYNFHKREHWNSIFQFMAKNMYQLQTNLSEIIPVLKEQINQ